MLIDRVSAKKYFLVSVLIFIFYVAPAQKNYFVYFQTEDYSPFYVRMNEKVFSSTSSGYLVLSRLLDKSYSINIGFQGNTNSEFKYDIIINEKDHGFLMKNLAIGNIELFDLQTNHITVLVDNKKDTYTKTEKTKSSSFTELLAKATDDSTLLETPIFIKEDLAKVESQKQNEFLTVSKKNDTVTSEIKIETITAVISESKEVEKILTSDITLQVIQPVLLEELVPYKKSTVRLYAESSTTDGFGLIFFDDWGNGKGDTVKIFIPNEVTKIYPQPVIQKEKQELKKFVEIISVDTAMKSIVIENTKSVESSLIKQDSIIEIKDVPKVKRIENCSVANEEDFFMLRKIMAGEINDSSMVAEARKKFLEKCFTTFQIKHLSVLFLNDDGKYVFFEAAVSFIADKENFSSLQSELKDKNYIDKFKSLIK
ncbi:MAG: hypothetical protein EPO57_00040 [Chitinophagaceae bacterium]|nr:MAG: hypothetical protein EPO57_00040 [Chitinophagaceae bacterium]